MADAGKESDICEIEDALSILQSENDLLRQENEKLSQQAEGAAAANAHAAELMAELEDRNEQLRTEIENREYLETELRKFNEQMERRIKDRTAKLRALNKHLEKEIAEHAKAEQLLKARTEQAIGHQSILLKLATIEREDLASTLKGITEEASETLDVERVGIWFFNEDRSEIVCEDLYNRGAGEHETGQRLRACDYPRYFEAMEKSRIIAAHDAQRSVHTREFTKEYLTPQGIMSMLDVPIRTHGTVVGVLCHEHMGPAREWTLEEQEFAGSVADLISLKLEASERKKAEEALEKLNRELSSTVEELSRSNRQLRDFVHIAAHDLKTPLRGIGTLADWISMDYGDKFDEQGREQVRLLAARVKRMDRLINSMLEYSRIVRNNAREQEVSLSELVSELIKDIEVPSNIEIILEEDLPKIVCERGHLERVFWNLLSNAVKYMDKREGRIRVGCVDEEGFWKFSVSDNGCGIEPRHFERIFKIYQTLSDRAGPENIGVGLTVAKKIIELYNGKIWVESRPGEGSTFFFTLGKGQK